MEKSNDIASLIIQKTKSHLTKQSMKFKHTMIMGALLSGASLFAGEPFILKTNNGDDFLKNKPALFAKKKSRESKVAAANANGESNMAVKLNISQLALKNISFQAEYGFHNKMSVALGVSYLLNRSLGLLYSTDTQYEDNFTVPQLSGFAITPEFRFYPGGNDDKPAPNGFYVGAYVRYAKYKITQTVSYQDTQTSPKYSAEAKQTYGGVNGGIMIGRQWIIGDHFSIDWWIVGAGYGKAKYTYSWTAPGANLTAAQQQDVKDEADANFESFSAFGLDSKVTTTKNSAMMTVTGVPMFSIRFMGLCLGYAF